ncbi:MAG: hypothetical protein WAL95_14950 [Candidatus Acidiferrales bacterium]
MNRRYFEANLHKPAFIVPVPILVPSGHRDGDRPRQKNHAHDTNNDPHCFASKHFPSSLCLCLNSIWRRNDNGNDKDNGNDNDNGNGNSNSNDNANANAND